MSDLIGHKRTREYFGRALKEGFLSHAYLLTGPEQIGKRTLVLDVIRSTRDGLEPGVSDPYTTLIEPDEKGTISIKDHIRPLKKALSLKPPGQVRLFVVIDCADRMTGPASQALLKIIEEPPSGATFLLISGSPGELPETIRSRCTEIRCVVPTEREISAYLKTTRVPEKVHGTLVRLANGSIGWLMDIIEQKAVSSAIQDAEELDTQLSKGIGERLVWAGALAKREYLRGQVIRWLNVSRRDVTTQPSRSRALIELYEALGRTSYNKRLALEHFVLHA